MCAITMRLLQERAISRGNAAIPHYLPLSHHSPILITSTSLADIKFTSTVKEFSWLTSFPPVSTQPIKHAITSLMTHASCYSNTSLLDIMTRMLSGSQILVHCLFLAFLNTGTCTGWGGSAGMFLTSGAQRSARCRKIASYLPFMQQGLFRKL